MNVLITGANGFIASNLINDIQDAWNIIGLSRSGISNAQQNYKVDLADTTSVKNFMQQSDIHIDLIIHTASALADKNNIKSMNLFYKNIAITENLIKIINNKKIKRLINFSSIAVYPNIDGTYAETSEIKPSVNNECLYGLSKFASENLFDFFLKDQVIQLLHLRLSQVYGEGMRNDRIYKIMEKELIEVNKVTIFGEGKRVSNFIDIALLITYIKYCIEEKLNGTYNIGSKNLTYLQLAKLIIANLNANSAKIILEERGVRSEALIDTSKFDTAYLNIRNNNKHD